MSKLNPLQIEAAEMLARGESPTAVRSQLELPQATFADWRADPAFVAAIQAEHERLETEPNVSSARIKSTVKSIFRRGRRRA